MVIGEDYVVMLHTTTVRSSAFFAHKVTISNTCCLYF
uniref:Uncharacterized protein n=1 Tax=Arundo donax TaxID=35708 RepID=A0A0A9B0Q9_ARUDO